MLNPILLLPGLRAQLGNKFRFFLVMLGIVLGSALGTFIFVVNEATVQSLTTNVQDLAGDTDLIVSSPGGESFPEEVLEKVLGAPGVASAVPLIQKKIFVSLPQGTELTLTLLGIDLLNDSSVRNKKDPTTRMVIDPLAFIASRNNIALTESFVQKHALSIGDSIQIVTATGAKSFVVSALVKDEGVGRGFGGTVAIMDIEAAKLAFGKIEKIDQINVALQNKKNLRKDVEAIQSLLGDNFTVEPPSSQVESLREIVGPFQIVLSFMGVMAFIMSFVLILNTARLSIEERRREMGILRALGTEKSVIFKTIFAEYFLLGFVGSAVGSFLSWQAAIYFVADIQASLVAQTQTVMQLETDMFRVLVPCLVTMVGTMTTLLAVFFPVLSIARQPPVDIIGRSNEEIQVSKKYGNLRGLFLLTGFLFLVPLLPLPFLKAPLFHVLPLIGAMIVGPWMAVVLLTGMAKWSRWASVPPLIELALSYAVAQPQRIEKSLRGLVIGLLMIFLISSVQSGFKEALAKMFIKTARPDFYVSSRGDFLSPMTLQALDDSLQQEIAKVEGVDGVYGQRIIQLKYQSRLIKLSAFDEVPPNTLEIPYSYFDVIDRPVAEAGHELYHGDAQSIMVSESFKSLFNKSTGDKIELAVLGRPLSFKIVGVVRDFTAGGGRIYIARNNYKKIWADPLVTGIALVLKKGVNFEEVRSEVERRFGPSHGLMITIDRGIKKDVENILNRSFASFHFIQLACILIASLGFISSYFIEIQNRAPELATLRITGLSRRELSILLSTESVLQGLSAGIVVLFLALPISWKLITQAMPVLLGWVVEFNISISLCVLTVLLGAVLAGLASLYASRGARDFDLADVG